MMANRRSFLLLLATAAAFARSAIASEKLPQPPTRLDYEASGKRLQQLGLLAAGDIPAMPDKMPRYDDEVLGVEFFRTLVGDGADLANLTLPRSYFGRSEISNVTFRNTDLSESSMCWNDFKSVDFSLAVLARCDLRASAFIGVRFVSTRLERADLRRSTFENCDFDNAGMSKAVLTRRQGRELGLSSAQRAEIAWTDDDGPEPDGG